MKILSAAFLMSAPAAAFAAPWTTAPVSVGQGFQDQPLLIATQYPLPIIPGYKR